MTNVQTFEFETESVRTFTVNGEPWFVAGDVCRILGLSNTTRAISRLEADEVTTGKVLDSRGVEQDTSLVNESGCFALILRSRKPQAKAFRRLVTGTILPAIRRTGQYVAPTAVDAISETQRLAAAVNLALPAITEGLQALDERTAKNETRIAGVESWQAQHDPAQKQAIKAALHRLKDALVNKTRDTADPVTWRSYWTTLREHIGVASFQDTSSITVDMLRKAEAFAVKWAQDRRAVGPELFTRTETEAA